MVNPADTGLAAILTSAATIVALQKWLKQRDTYAKFVAAFPLADKYVHWLVAGTGSLIAAVGVQVTWTGSIWEGGAFSGTYPSIVTMAHGIGHWFTIYITQHTIYEGTHQPPYVVPPSVPPRVPEPAPLVAGQPPPPVPVVPLVKDEP